jgi:hypothetical protein
MMGDSIEDDIDCERSFHPPRDPSSTGDTTIADETLPSKDANSTADIEDQFNTDAIVDEMIIEDLRHLAKCIIRVAKDNKYNRILSEVNFLIRRQQHQRRKHDANHGDENPISSSTALDPSHPDSILSLPPLLGSSRSHDSDRETDSPKLFSRRKIATSREPMSPTVRTSNKQRREVVKPTTATQNEPSNIDGSDGKKERRIGIADFGKRQLLVLCNRKPATEKECKDQDLAMTLCKNMGIIPCVIVSALSSEITTATKEEQLLVDSMTLNAGGETAPAYLYPQFFVRNILQDQNIDERNAMIDYKGNYDTMEELYRSGRFGADSLEVILAASARGAADTTSPRKNDNKEMLGSFIRETSKPAVPKGGNTRASASVGEPSLPSPRHKSSQKPPSEQPQLSPQPRPDQQSSSPPRSRSQSPELQGSINNSSSSSSNSLHLLDLSNSDSLQYKAQNGDTSYSHLDGMNQPKSIQSSTSSGSCGEVSLGDDLRMIFDIEIEVGAISTVEEANEAPGQTPASIAAVATITEDEDEEDEEDSNVIPARTPTDPVAVPTITEDEEEDEDEEEKDEAEDLKTSSVSMTVLSSGAIVKRETVTLKPRKEGPEPPGTMAGTVDASGYLDQARGSLKSPPSSPKKFPSAFKPVEPKRKKIPNPYYALDYYSGDGNGGDNSQTSETNLPGAESSPPNHPDPVATVIDPPGDEGEATEMPAKDDAVKVLEREYLSWEKKFIGIGACYLVFHGGDDELNIHYSESPMANAVGVWTSPDIANFKATQGLSECELIGTCASQVTKDEKYYCQGWCQFVKAAKIMDATVTALVDVGLPMEIYLYDKGHTIQVSPCDGEAVFDTKVADAIACVPKGCGFPASGIVGKKWGKIAKNLGAVALFRSLSIKKSKDIDDENLVKHSTNNSSVVREISVPIAASHDELASTLNTLDVISPVPSAPKSLSSIIDHFPKTALISDSPAEPEAPTEPKAATSLSSKSTLNTLDFISPVPSAPKSLSSIIDHFPKTAPISDSPAEPEAPTEPKAVTSLSSKLPCPDGGACYLAYDPDSSGQLVEHYCKTPVDFAIGRWIPGSEKKIAGFKFKRNVGRNVLIGNCSGGVQGRKNFYSGWCQFVRSAKNMKGEVILWDPAVGHKGLKVDVYLYYDDYRPYHQTVRMEEGTTYTTDKIVAVSCLPKETPFFESMTVDLLLWLAKGSKHGYSTKM